MAETVKIRLVRSPIGTTRAVRATVRALGLTRLGSESQVVLSPATEGMLRRVSHLVVRVSVK